MIDTARVYYSASPDGDTETTLGEALRETSRASAVESTTFSNSKAVSFDVSIGQPHCMMRGLHSCCMYM